MGSLFRYPAIIGSGTAAQRASQRDRSVHTDPEWPFWIGCENNQSLSDVEAASGNVPEIQALVFPLSPSCSPPRVWYREGRLRAEIGGLELRESERRPLPRADGGRGLFRRRSR